MKQSTIAKAALFMTAVLWGSTFTIGKLASEAFSASFIIALIWSVIEYFVYLYRHKWNSAV